MKSTDKILIALAAGVVAGLVVYMLKKSEEQRVLDRIAAEGYETAHDVLFPDRTQTGKKLHYGPVLPE
ncbi:MAG: hypothetical protein M9933_00760 [Chitinophagaceae bacterium]|nr:hypothetical protein [Chitinophagaceae bacterium]